MVGPGTYLRARIDQYELDMHSHGRIWRLRYDGMERDRTCRGCSTRAQRSSSRLCHPNGWWRDTAQQLLVLKQDKSVVPALQAIVRSTNLLGRFHALWTLEGLGSLDATLVRQQMKDTSRGCGFRRSAPARRCYKAGDSSFAADYQALAKDATPTSPFRRS